LEDGQPAAKRIVPAKRRSGRLEVHPPSRFRVHPPYEEHSRGTFAATAIYLIMSRKESRSMNEEHPKPGMARPAMIALAVAVVGMLAMLIVDHGPWSRPHVRSAEMVDQTTTTGSAAQAVGAKVTPTAPKAQIEPVSPGPKRVHPEILAPGVP
jgi:hypothetical protein